MSIPMWWRGLCAALVLLSLVSARAEDNPEIRRRQMIQALGKGVLRPRDVGFATYVQLGMWDELETLFQSHAADGVTRAALSLGRPSRVVVVRDRLWVFDAMMPERERIPLAVHPSSLRAEPVSGYPETLRRRWGVVAAPNDEWMVFGGTDEDHGLAAAWNMTDDEVRFLSLAEGRYVTALLTDNGRLFMGACGGVVNSWQMASTEYLGMYVMTEEPPADGIRFNALPCIEALHLFNGVLHGAGQDVVVEWPPDPSPPRRIIRKALPGSVCRFFRDRFVEVRDQTLALHFLSGAPGRSISLPHPVADVIVTRDALLEGNSRPLICVAYRNGAGVDLLDLETLARVRFLKMTARWLAVVEGCLLGVSSDGVEKFDGHPAPADEIVHFKKTIRFDGLPSDMGVQERIRDLARRYPDLIPPERVAAAILKPHSLSMMTRVQYGRIENSEEPSGEKTGEESRYGYRLECVLKNHSDQDMAVALDTEWWGVRGRGNEDRGAPHHRLTWMMAPAGSVITETVSLGTKEPLRVMVWPGRVESLPDDYLKNLDRVLEGRCQDRREIQRYLSDEKASKWHDILTTRMAQAPERGWFF